MDFACSDGSNAGCAAAVLARTADAAGACDVLAAPAVAFPILLTSTDLSRRSSLRPGCRLDGRLLRRRCRNFGSAGGCFSRLGLSLGLNLSLDLSLAPGRLAGNAHDPRHLIAADERDHRLALRGPPHLGHGCRGDRPGAAARGQTEQGVAGPGQSRAGDVAQLRRWLGRDHPLAVATLRRESRRQARACRCPGS